MYKVKFHGKFNLYLYVSRILQHGFSGGIPKISLRNGSFMSIIHRRCDLMKIGIRNNSSFSSSSSSDGSGSRHGVSASRTTQNLVRGLRALFYVSVRLVLFAGYTYFFAHERGKLVRGRNCFAITTGYRRFPGMPDRHSEVQEAALRAILFPSLRVPAPIYCYRSRPFSLTFFPSNLSLLLSAPLSGHFEIMTLVDTFLITGAESVRG